MSFIPVHGAYDDKYMMPPINVSNKIYDIMIGMSREKVLTASLFSDSILSGRAKSTTSPPGPLVPPEIGDSPGLFSCIRAPLPARMRDTSDQPRQSDDKSKPGRTLSLPIGRESKPGGLSLAGGASSGASLNKSRGLPLLAPWHTLKPMGGGGALVLRPERSEVVMVPSS